LSEPSPASDDLESMTKAQLLEYAEQNGITGVNSSMKKAEIIAAIEGES
jgi:branched-subunit amino acid aminotransferase/4-amino-4-deoxychorismate lyase